MPRNEICWAGPSVLSVLTTRPKSEKSCCARCSVARIGLGCVADEQKVVQVADEALYTVGGEFVCNDRQELGAHPWG